MEIEKRAGRQHTIQPAPTPIPTITYNYSVLSPLGSLQYSFISRVNVSQLYGQFDNCPCPDTVRHQYA
jgi:hypothetical protein